MRWLRVRDRWQERRAAAVAALVAIYERMEVT